MSSMKSIARLDKSHHGPSKDSGAVADNMTGIQNAMTKYPFVVNRSCIHKGFQISAEVKIHQRI
jgi:hypothetical protein